MALGADEAVRGNSVSGELVLTLSTVDPPTWPEVAEMVVCPTNALLARPAPVIVATLGIDEVQFAMLVTSWMVPSVKVPLAANCCAAPNRIVGLTGATAIETSAAGVTVRPALPEVELDVALMLVNPADRLDTRPELPGVLLTVATGPAEDVQ